jgi:hypothetical protein
MDDKLGKSEEELYWVWETVQALDWLLKVMTSAPSFVIVIHYSNLL